MSGNDDDWPDMSLGNPAAAIAAAVRAPAPAPAAPPATVAAAPFWRPPKARSAAEHGQLMKYVRKCKGSSSSLDEEEEKEAEAPDWRLDVAYSVSRSVSAVASEQGEACLNFRKRYNSIKG